MRALLLSAAVLLSGCDSARLWSDPPYVVFWIDDPKAIRLSYDQGSGSMLGLVDAKVVAVGSNKHFVVAQQATGGYFYIEKPGGPEAVVGPLSFEEFSLKKKALLLPDFTKEFEPGALKDGPPR